MGSSVSSGTTGRTAFYDNLKFVLIALVLIGHFMGPMRGQMLELKVLWRWIYMFHMPAFLFVGGMFAKKLYTPEKGLRVNVIAFYLLMGLLMYTGLWLEQHLWHPKIHFNLFEIAGIPWYFFVMAALGASTPIAAKIKGGGKAVVPVAVVIAILAPMHDNFDDFLVLGRIAAYAPFYFAGYFLPIQGYAQWASRMRKRIWPVILAVACMVAVYVALLVLPKGATKALTLLATGHNTYVHMTSHPLYVYMCIKLMAIGIGALMIVSLSLIVPSRKCLMSDLGSRTLQVYFFHPFIYYPLGGFGFFKLLNGYAPLSGWLCIPAAVLIAILLAWPKWPERMFRALRNRIRIDNAE